MKSISAQQLRKYFSIVSVLLVACCSSLLGQKQYLQCEQKRYTVIKFVDVPIEAATNWHVTQKLVNPINKSKADFEIRFYDAAPITSRGSFFIISGLKGKILFQRVIYQWSAIKDSSFRKDHIVNSDGKGYGLFKEIKVVSIKKDKCDFIKKLIDFRIFEVKDFDEIYDSLQKRKVEFNSPKLAQGASYIKHYSIIEIKLNNHFRMFKIEQIFASLNKHIESLNDQYNISRLINSSFNLQ